MGYKLSYRNLHRDTAYFYVGLIISFSISGIALNHRASWNAREYVVTSEEINVEIPSDMEGLGDDFGKELAASWDMADKYKSIRVRGEEARVFFEGAVADFNINSGIGELETVRRRHGMREMAILHQTTDKAWIWYSDIFGLAMLLIATTGMFIARGKESFRQRGWKFAIIGIIFPLIFLWVLM